MCLLYAENELYLSCKGDSGQVVMQACLTLGTAPFDSLNGSYTTLEFYFPRHCEGTLIIPSLILGSALHYS